MNISNIYSFYATEGNSFIKDTYFYLTNNSTVLYRTVCDMCRGVGISSNLALSKFAPLRFASHRSDPDKSQCCPQWKWNDYYSVTIDDFCVLVKTYLQVCSCQHGRSEIAVFQVDMFECSHPEVDIGHAAVFEVGLSQVGSLQAGNLSRWVVKCAPKKWKHPDEVIG